MQKHTQKMQGIRMIGHQLEYAAVKDFCVFEVAASLDVDGKRKRFRNAKLRHGFLLRRRLARGWAD
jgi:hypothetical protein